MANHAKQTNKPNPADSFANPTSLLVTRTQTSDVGSGSTWGMSLQASGTA
jgi:hypothetical protein